MSCNCEFKDEPSREDIKNKLSRYDWNVTLGKEHIPMRVCKVDGCIHTKGGKYGINDLYVYDRNIKKEDIKPEDLTPFNGTIPWGFEVQQRNYWREDEMSFGTFGKIFCAGKQVYEVRASFESISHRIMTTIEDLKELPINIGTIDYEQKMIGMKIFFKDKPAIITSYIKDQGCIIIQPDGDIKDFGKACWESEEDYKYSFEGFEKVDILSKHIYWFRDL